MERLYRSYKNLVLFKPAEIESVNSLSRKEGADCKAIIKFRAVFCFLDKRKEQVIPLHYAMYFVEDICALLAALRLQVKSMGDPDVRQ